MSDSSAQQNACAFMDEIMGDFILLDTSDLPVMARFATRLDVQAKDLETGDASEWPAGAAVSLREAADLLKDVILNRVDSKEQSIKGIENMLGGIRSAMPSDSAPEAEPLADSSPASDGASGEESSSSASDMSWLDDTILAAFVEQQQSVLPEIEQHILRYEKEQEGQALADMRRLIHTLKGEAGAVGANAIERVCHRLEDFLDHPPEVVATDVLLDAKDWLDNAVASFGRGEAEVETETVLAAFMPAPPPASPPEEDLPAEPSPDPSVTESDNDDAFDLMEREEVTLSVDINDTDLAKDFVVEAAEHFDIADENLLILEKRPDDVESVSAVFRSFHTIKGVAGFLDLKPISELSHAAETVLDQVRKGQRVFEGTTVELIFGAFDMLKMMVADLHTGLDTDGKLSVRPEWAVLLSRLNYLLADDEQAAAHPIEELNVQSVATEIERTPGEDSAASTFAAPLDENASAASASVPSPSKPTAAASGGTPASQTMKVDVARIDLLLDAIGELVIAESIVSGDPEIRALNSLKIEKNLSLLGKITHSLRDMGMSMRMVPVDPVFRKMTRLVRDLSHKSGKKVDMQIEGGDTEIDKGMVEKLGDPLVHMIRNSMDHGLESVAEREASGKTPEGRITLRAHHVGGNIHIDIEDDGRGLNRDAIIERAVDRGLIASPDGLTDQELYSLIFHAGFSTAKAVTEISGRGVGMDVVKRNIESLRGNVLIRSTPGQGSTFTLVLPLTTAIIDGMLTRVGKEIYIIPTLTILESLRPLQRHVHVVTGRGEMLSFRDELLPLFRLSFLLGVPGAQADVTKAIVVVVEEFGKRWGLLVDDILGQQQVVIKSLGAGIGRMDGIAGASILADGSPGLILDIGGVIKVAIESGKP